MPSLEEPNANELPLPEPSPSPSPTPESTEGTETAAPQYLPPLPGAPGTQAAATSGMPMQANPSIEQQYSEWDMAQIESPLFLSAAINDLSERPIMLTDNWSLKPHLSTGSFYDGNVFLRSDDVQSDYVTRIAPGLTMRLGNDDSMFYMMADDSVGLNYYMEHPKESTADNEGRGQFQWTMPRTIIGVSLDVSSDTGQDIDVSDRVRRDLYFAGVTAHYDFGEKTSWDLSGSYTRSDFAGLISSSQWEGDLFFNYQYSPKTQIGAGGAGGYLVVPGGQNQVYEQANVRATYQATGKLTLNGQVGTELREYQGGHGSTISPVFIVDAAWAARPDTGLDLSLRRSIYASALLDDQDYTATSLDFSIRQRITKYVEVSLSTGYVNTSYSATAAGVAADREDNYYYIRPAVDWNVLSWMSIGIYYEYSKDASQGGVANSFARDTGGVDIAILF
jgi:outer membrane protein assembly factor BamA